MILSNKMTSDLFGIKKTDAIEQNTCVSCKLTVKGYLTCYEEVKVYIESGLCPHCFSVLTKEKR